MKMIFFLCIIMLCFFGCNQVEKTSKNNIITRQESGLKNQDEYKVDTSFVQKPIFKFDASKLIINGKKISNLTETNIITDTEFVRNEDNEGTVQYYKGKSYVQFYKGKLMFIDIVDENITIDNPNIELNTNFSSLFKNQDLKSSVDYLDKLKCLSTSFSDMYDNQLKVYHLNDKVLEIVYSAYFDLDEFNEEMDSPEKN